MSTIYRKQGNKYVAIGEEYQTDWLGDGLWLVKSRNHSKSITSMDYLSPLTFIGTVPKLDVMQLCGTAEYIDAITDSLIELEDKLKAEAQAKGEVGYCISHRDRAKAALQTILSMNEKK